MSLLVITLNRISQPIINLRVPNFFEGNGGGVVYLVQNSTLVMTIYFFLIR